MGKIFNDLTTAQQNAINSGVTSAKVSAYDGLLTPARKVDSIVPTKQSDMQWNLTLTSFTKGRYLCCFNLRPIGDNTTVGYISCRIDSATENDPYGGTLIKAYQFATMSFVVELNAGSHTFIFRTDTAYANMTIRGYVVKLIDL